MKTTIGKQLAFLFILPLVPMMAGSAVAQVERTPYEQTQVYLAQYGGPSTTTKSGITLNRNMMLTALNFRLGVAGYELEELEIIVVNHNIHPDGSYQIWGTSERYALGTFDIDWFASPEAMITIWDDPISSFNWQGKRWNPDPSDPTGEAGEIRFVGHATDGAIIQGNMVFYATPDPIFGIPFWGKQSGVRLSPPRN